MQPGRILNKLDEMRKPVALEIGATIESSILDGLRSADRRVLWSGVQATNHSEANRTRQTRGSNSNWSKRSTFERYIVICSIAQVWSPKLLKISVDGRSYEFAAPRGYRWAKDANGVSLVGKAGDYHPTASELINDGPRGIVAKIKSNAQIRRQASAEVKRQKNLVKIAEKEGCMISLKDSVRAGNCYAGSLQWAKNHGFTKSHYRPSEIAAKANGETNRVSIVIAMAIRRHRAEMDRGYCLINEHI